MRGGEGNETGSLVLTIIISTNIKGMFNLTIP